MHKSWLLITIAEIKNFKLIHCYWRSACFCVLPNGAMRWGCQCSPRSGTFSSMLSYSGSEGTTATANVPRRAVHATKLVNKRALHSFSKFIFVRKNEPILKLLAKIILNETLGKYFVIIGDYSLTNLSGWWPMNGNLTYIHSLTSFTIIDGIYTIFWPKKFIYAMLNKFNKGAIAIEKLFEEI